MTLFLETQTLKKSKIKILLTIYLVITEVPGGNLSLIGLAQIFPHIYSNIQTSVKSLKKRIEDSLLNQILQHLV